MARRKVRAYVSAGDIGVSEGCRIELSITKSKHVVTSRLRKAFNPELTPEMRMVQMVSDILRCDVFVLVSGGVDHHCGVELGLALSMQKPVLYVGSLFSSHFFHALTQVTHYKTWLECRDAVFPMPEYVKEKTRERLKKGWARRFVQRRLEWQNKKRIEEQMRELG